MKNLAVLVVIVILSAAPLCRAQDVELIYAEMEFPMSFAAHIEEYRFDPLARFQTEVDGRIMELTCDSLVDLYQSEGQLVDHRPCLATYRTMKLRARTVLNFELADVKWPDGRELDFSDVLFSLQYRKTNPLSWGDMENLNIEERSGRSFDAYLIESQLKAPEPGQFYFPIVNKAVFHKSRSPAQAIVNKQKQNSIGYGRYYIADIEENRYILMNYREEHPYYRNLKLPDGYQRIGRIRMYAFPRARIQRNTEFAEGKVHLITSANQQDVDWIIHSYPETQVSRYYDNSFSGFVFNCRHPLLQPPAVRRALNYVFRKKLALDRALRGQGQIISGPIPTNSSFYDIEIPPYEDSIPKAIAVLKLYRYWGLDIYEDKKTLVVGSNPLPGPCTELQAGDKILKVEEKQVKTLEELVSEFAAQGGEVFRVSVRRDDRIYTLRLHPAEEAEVGEWRALEVTAEKVENFPALDLIANNPGGKDDLIKEICGALKEDLALIGIEVKIDYLDAHIYYPRLQNGDFDLAFRTLKITGTPSLYRMFYKQLETEKARNANYGAYDNAKINAMGEQTKNVIDTDVLIDTWKKAHRVLHHDPPYLYLWSRRHILLYSDRLKVIRPNPEYKIPHGYKQIDGLINIFNEVHLWAMQE